MARVFSTILGSLAEGIFVGEGSHITQTALGVNPTAGEIRFVDRSGAGRYNELPCPPGKKTAKL
jgi:hypothetical protein